MRDSGRPDEWTRKAKAAGYAARSVYKLEEIARRELKLPKKGRVLDLGCSPGSWSQYLLRSGGKKVHLVGLDITEMPDYPGSAFVQASALDVDPATLLEALGGPAQLVMSDMAPFTHGDRFSDHIRQLELAQAALRIATQVLEPGGDFVVKVFEGEDAPAFVQEVRSHFGRVRRLRPKVVRRESVEFFVVGRGFKV
ncbi:MAG: 23S rRNA (uridine2552-2'-O)-methyltransferase [Myxococcota bacterium]|jgi:23S rRNA (uridine2552-2'-O)-methyltransferase